MEYQICFIYYYYYVFFANRYKYRAETCLWLFYESVFTEDNIVSSRCKRKQSYKALKNTRSYPTICPTPIDLEVLEFQSLHG